MRVQPESVAVYLVHLWTHEAANGFRACVRRVDSDEAEFFSAAAALTQYFENQAKSGQPSGAPAESRGEE
jgi:hypothetical protein